MAIQAINLTVPGGDTPRSANTKINANFSNTTHAASRLVGEGLGNVLEFNSKAAGGLLTQLASDQSPEAALQKGLFISTLRKDVSNTIFGLDKVPNNSLVGIITHSPNRATVNETYMVEATFRLISHRNRLFHQSATGDNFSEVAWAKSSEIYTTSNTTKEPTTGYLKAASPILHLFNDDLVKEHEAVEQDITVEKLGTGDYLIKGSTGLSSEGWNLSPPKDIHGNVLCMVEATEADGKINVKTYKRKFDFDIVAIVPDYDQPFDIPAGHSVDLRLNDLPQETQTEV